MVFFELYKKKIIIGGSILFAVLFCGLFLYIIQYTGGPLARYAQRAIELRGNFFANAKKENWKLFVGTNNSKSPFYLDFEGNYSPIFSETNYISQVSISPNGKKVVFREGDFLNITEIDGSKKEKLLENYNGRIAIYSSANNNEIAFLSDYNFDKESFSLYLFNIKNKSAKIIADGLVSALGTPTFSWSPDGEKIAFTSIDGKLMVINKDGSGLQEICDSGNSPAWSPDGRTIVYRGDKFFIEKFNNGETLKGVKTGDSIYYTIDIETQVKRKLIGNNSFNDIPTQPVWSPNGAYILLYQMYDTIPIIDVANFKSTDFWVIDVAKGKIAYNFSYDLRPSFMKWLKDNSGNVKDNDVSRFTNPDENRVDSTNANINNLTCQKDSDCIGNCVDSGCYNRALPSDCDLKPVCVCSNNICVKKSEISKDLSCNDLETKIDGLLLDAKSCNSSSDCMLDTENHFGCPFGCDFIRNKSFDISPIKDAVNEYRNKCEVCEYECLTPPEQKDIICKDNKCVDDRFTSLAKDEQQKIGFAFNAYVSAEEKCDINLANSQIAEESKSMMHYTCENMASESKCYKDKEFEILDNGDRAILYFPPFNHKTGWPFFFTKEDDEWKIDFKKMASGIAMGGGGCDTGWGWRNSEIEEEFCSYFSAGGCPEK